MRSAGVGLGFALGGTVAFFGVTGAAPTWHRTATLLTIVFCGKIMLRCERCSVSPRLYIKKGQVDSIFRSLWICA